MWAGVGWGILSIASGILVDQISAGNLRKDYTLSYFIMMGIFIVDIAVVCRLKV